MYKTFDLLLLNKFYSSPVELGISGAYIEITSKQGGNKSPSTHFADRLLSKFQQIKPQTIQVENVVDAFLLPKHCKYFLLSSIAPQVTFNLFP